MFRTVHDIALMIDGASAGREPDPSAAVIDSQTVKAPAAHGTRGYDGAKKLVGRKRRIAVDPEGRLLMVNLTTADIVDSTGAQMVLDAIHQRWPWVRHLFANSAYDRRQLLDKAAFLGFTVEIVRRTEAAFVVLPKRWVVERTFGWIIRCRRLVRDDEARIDVAEAMIHIALGGLLITRLAHPSLSNGPLALPRPAVLVGTCVLRFTATLKVFTSASDHWCWICEGPRWARSGLKTLPSTRQTGNIELA